MKKIQIPKRILIAALLVLLVASSIATGSILAKYVKTIKEGENTPVTAKLFYFESDFLAEPYTNKKYALNSQITSVSFELYNFDNEKCSDPACENCQHTSQVACEYTINVTSPTGDTFTVKVNGEEGTTATSPKDKKTVHIVTLEGLAPNNEYEVTVTANGGYQKTMSATFSVAKENSGFYMNVDASNEQYVILTVWTEGTVKGDVEIKVPAGLIPDNTDPLLKDKTNYNETDKKYGEFIFEDATSFDKEFSSRSYRFFKTTDYNAQESNFEVTMGETRATESDIS